MKRDSELSDQEKQPMTGGGERAAEAPAAGGEAEKNGSVKLKIPEEKEDDDEEEVKFTGLSKEELLRVAGTPGWVRTRWALLVVFWLGWLGMLIGSVLIILHAPRCRELPSTRWWNHGALYQVGDVRAFSDTHNLRGVEQKLELLAQLKVSGLVVGPVHEAPADDALGLRFEEVSSEAGSLEQFKSLIQAAHKRGISVVLDLTPNYRGSSGPWFSSSSVTNVAERLKSALVFWLSEGVDGVQLSGPELVSKEAPSLWADIRAIVQNGTEGRPGRLLIGVTEQSSAEDVSDLLSSTGVDLLISRVLLSPEADALERAQSVQQLYSNHSQLNLAWSLGGRAKGHLATLGGPALVRLYQLLLLTLPGTPVFNYGDEIGLMDEENKFPMMLWDWDDQLNETLQEERAEQASCRKFFRSLSELRVKERSLMFGDYLLLSNSSSSLAYLRSWDQSTRFLAAFNWAPDTAVLQLSDPALPLQAVVVLSTNSSALPVQSSVALRKLRLGPGQAALFSFPYSG
uniref:Solute carrier family 3 member 2b n=1 Tax=Salarias fasciatus TaxID=181472 RepID=A0A672HJR7_SALFA